MRDAEKRRKGSQRESCAFPGKMTAGDSAERGSGMACEPIGFCQGSARCRSKCIHCDAERRSKSGFAVKVSSDPRLDFKTDPDGKRRSRHRGNRFVPVFRTGELTTDGNDSPFPLVQREFFNRTLADAAVKIVVHVRSAFLSSVIFSTHSCAYTKHYTPFSKKVKSLFSFFLIFSQFF